MWVGPFLWILSFGVNRVEDRLGRVSLQNGLVEHAEVEKYMCNVH